jgi:hypothetical protein
VLHPAGFTIAHHAARLMQRDSISQANDRGASFAEIAAALRQARAELERGA